LRRVDVKAAAQENQLDADAFLDLIEHVDAVPLATNPITLKFLLKTYRANGGFPSRRADLYFEGCKELCREPNPDRVDGERVRSLNEEQRLAVAARIAAVTVLGGRDAVSIETSMDELADAAVAARDLAGRTEVVGGEEFEVSEAVIREAVATGLFSARGSRLMGWSHQTYAEYLAAHYVDRRGIPLPQVMSLLVHPGDPQGKLVPQLHSAAAWLAGMRRDVFREIIVREPEVLHPQRRGAEGRGPARPRRDAPAEV
jgi:predicted NACHT family NTPase